MTGPTSRDEFIEYLKNIIHPSLLSESDVEGAADIMVAIAFLEAPQLDYFNPEADEAELDGLTFQALQALGTAYAVGDDGELLGIPLMPSGDIPGPSEADQIFEVTNIESEYHLSLINQMLDSNFQLEDFSSH